MARGGQDVSSEPLQAIKALPLDVVRRLDPVCDRFEGTWLAGPPRIEDYLKEVVEADRPALLRELLLLDLEYRTRAGNRPSAQEYHQRFPDSGTLIETVFETVPIAAPQTGPQAPVHSDIVPDSPFLSDWPIMPGYEILGELGRGGMGVVYKARHIGLSRIVALKMILQISDSKEGLLRFRTEAEALARLQHPNIILIYDVGEYLGRPFFSMEFADGGRLSDRVGNQLQEPAVASQWVEVLARAMQSAHEHGIVHRDLKPANILFAADGTLKITDFGLAKRLDEPGQTISGAVLGTPSYMPPEQAAGQAQVVGPTADVYSLGAILYFLLTGQPPFKAATGTETLQQVLTKDAAPVRQFRPEVPRELESICIKCLRKKPIERYGHAVDLANDLSTFLASEISSSEQ
jgi:eukaryotic-like serine/threonine-protein kinase